AMRNSVGRAFQTPGLGRQSAVRQLPSAMDINPVNEQAGQGGPTGCDFMMQLTRRFGLAALLAVLAVAPPAYAKTAGTITKDHVAMELGKDGVLHVKETITLSGGPVERTMITRTRYDDSHDRIYRISNVKGATFDGEKLTISKSG